NAQAHSCRACSVFAIVTDQPFSAFLRNPSIPLVRIDVIRSHRITCCLEEPCHGVPMSASAHDKYWLFSVFLDALEHIPLEDLVCGFTSLFLIVVCRCVNS